MEKLKEYRKKNNYTQIDIAKYLNIDQTTYSCYEIGKSEPSIDTLIKLSNLYNIDINELLGTNSTNYTKEQQEILTIFNQLKDIGKGKLIGYAKSLLEDQNKNNKKIITNYIDWTN